MTREHRFVQPVDALTLRGNKLFGSAAGDLGDSQFPPRPSVLAGALRSALLTQAGGAINGFMHGQRLPDVELDRILGIPREPGAFRLERCLPARQLPDGRLEVLFPVPADLLVSEESGGSREARLLEPQALPAGISSSLPAALPLVAVERRQTTGKPAGGYLLGPAGLKDYIEGRAVEATDLVPQRSLWRQELRVGIGISAESRTVAEGKLFTAEYTVLRQLEHAGADRSAGVGAGLAVTITGTGNRLPEQGFLRLGGDGRVAAYRPMSGSPLEGGASASVRDGRFKLVLTAPGLFKKGWLPDGVDNQSEELWLNLDGFRARLECAAVPRFETVSGWDLAAGRPKVAARATATGTVYWFDRAEGSAEALDAWLDEGLGLWRRDRSRWAEGFNAAIVAVWGAPLDSRHPPGDARRTVPAGFGTF